MKRWVALVLVLAVTGCSTFVTIRTDPEDAKIYINDEPKGTAPFHGDLADGLGARYLYRIEAEGYKTTYGELQKEIKWGAFIGGWFFLIPFIWASGPKPMYFIELEKQ